MGCRPAKLSKVSSLQITDSITKCQNGNKIIFQKSNTNEKFEDFETNKTRRIISKVMSFNGKTINECNEEKGRNAAKPRKAWKANKKSRSSHTVSPLFKNVPTIVLERSKSQIDFFRQLDDRINRGQSLHPNQMTEI